MLGARRVLPLAMVIAVLLAWVAIGPAKAQVPLPPPPSLPPVSVPDQLEPIIAVASPTAGPVCGTGSLLTLLAPSLVEGFFKIPLSSLLDSSTFRAYGRTALYVCGFVPYSLTPTQCEADRQIVDALRGLNPLAAQVVGLFPEGATVDTVLAIEALLPSGPSVAGPLVDQLEALMTCTRSAGAPAVPPTSEPLPEPLPAPVAVADDGSGGGASGAGVGGGLGAGAAAVATPAAAAAPGETTQGALPTIYETMFRQRTGVQRVGLMVGVLLLLGSAIGWLWSRRQPA